MKLLVSTFDALLMVEMTAAGGGSRRVEVLADDRGVYFGLSRDGGTVYVVARNLTPDRGPRVPSPITNAIEEWDIERRTMVHRWTHPLMFDLHQIRVRGEHLFVVNGRKPCLLIFDRRSRTLVRTLDLNALVPAHLAHPAPEQHPADRYHFNSISFTRDGRMFILAHNWGAGSFAFEFSCTPLSVLSGGWRLEKVHENRGWEAHDILQDGGDQFVVDSRRNRLVRNGEAMLLFPDQGFPRGLAATRRHFYVTSGLSSRGRGGRTLTPTQLTIIDRKTGLIANRVPLGDFGNSADVTLLDADDLTDFDPLAKRRGLRRRLDRGAAALARWRMLPAIGIGELAGTPDVRHDTAPDKRGEKPVAGASRPSGVNYELQLDGAVLSARQGETLTIRGTINNAGSALPPIWAGGHKLQLGAEVFVGEPRKKTMAARLELGGTDGIAANASVPFAIDIRVGDVPPGPCIVHIDLLYERLVWLGKIGGHAVEVAAGISPAMSFDGVDEDCSVTEPRFWQQHVPAYNPASRMNVRSPSFQDYTVATSRGPVAARSMLTSYELALLYSLARYHWQGRGHIVDLGPLLGLGTYAMADGLAQNRIARGNWRIYSYDLFMMEYMDHFLPATDGGQTGSVFNRFLEINRDFLDAIVPVPGNVLKTTWTGQPIEILFIDLAKSWALNRHVVGNFFPHLIPGHSIVIQQDYVHAGEPWVAATMELFDEYFERLYFVYGASAVYRLVKPIPAEVLGRDLQKDPMTDQLFDRARSKASAAIAEVLKCCQAAVRAERGDIAGAQSLLDSVDATICDGADPSQEFGPAILASLQAVRRSVQRAREREY